MLATLALSLALVVSEVESLGPCDLLNREAASELLGQQVATPAPSGPEPDEDTGGTRTTCVYQAGTRMLILVRVAYASAAAAREATTQELVEERYGEGEDDFRVTEEPGLGDKAYWAYNPRAAEFIVIKGPTVLALILGGMPKEPSTYRAQLRGATAMATTKL